MRNDLLNSGIVEAPGVTWEEVGELPPCVEESVSRRSFAMAMGKSVKSAESVC
jgi:hypothetical protein